MTVELHHGDDLALPDTRPTAPVARINTIAHLAEWAQSARAAHGIAQSLVETSFVPQAFRGKPHEATAAILSGAEVGLSPMASLRSFDIIQGTAAPRALALRAIVQSQGHEIRVVESTETRAIVEGRRRNESTWQRSVWTIDRARAMALLGKDNWKKQPGAMLVARATSEVCRWIGSDAIAGIGYTVEELSDDAAPSTAPVSDAPQATARPRTARRQPLKSVPSPAAEPDFDEPVQTTTPAASAEPDFEEATPVSGPPADSAVPMITEAQQRKMHALFREVDVKDRDIRLQYVSEVLGREVGSSKELTLDDARMVIDKLQSWADSLQPTAEEVTDVVGEQR